MLRGLILCLAAVLGLCGNLVAEPESVTFVNVLYTPGTDSLRVGVVLSIIDPADSSSIKLLLNPGIAIRELVFQLPDDTLTAEFHRALADTLIIERPAQFLPGQPVTIKFDLRYPLDAGNDSLIILDRGNRWYPIMPRGVTTATIDVLSPIRLDVFVAGESTYEQLGQDLYKYHFQPSIPVFKIPLIIARPWIYKQKSAPAGDHEITLAYNTVSDSSAEQILNESSQILQYFEQKLGMYHHKTLRLVEIPEMEGINIATSTLMIGSPMLHDIAAGNYDPLIQTIAEQWFGAGVFCEFSEKGFWFLSLSLAHHLRMMYQTRSGDEAYRAAWFERSLKRYRDFAGTDKDLPILDVVRPDTPEKGVVLYVKGPYVVEVMRLCKGDAAWWDFMRQCYERYLGKVMHLDDFLGEALPKDSDCAARVGPALYKTGLE